MLYKHARCEKNAFPLGRCGICVATSWRPSWQHTSGSHRTTKSRNPNLTRNPISQPVQAVQHRPPEVRLHEERADVAATHHPQLTAHPVPVHGLHRLNRDVGVVRCSHHDGRIWPPRPGRAGREGRRVNAMGPAGTGSGVGGMTCSRPMYMHGQWGWRRLSF